MYLKTNSLNGQNANGFSLIEVLIGLTIFAIGILAVSSLIVSSNLLSRRSTEITQATGIGSDQMEDLLLRPFDHADLDPVLNPHQQISGKYLVRWLVTEADLDADGVNDSKTVDMTITWNAMFQPFSNQRQVRMVLLKHDL